MKKSISESYIEDMELITKMRDDRSLLMNKLKEKLMELKNERKKYSPKDKRKEKRGMEQLLRY